MAPTTAQLKVEAWIRENWLPPRFHQPFSKRSLPLDPGGTFEFDAVSHDGTIAVTISTSGARTATGRYGAGKVQKIRADALFLLLAQADHTLLVFTERDMFDLCEKEAGNGRLPRTLELRLVEDVPKDLRELLEESRRRASSEVSPRHAR